MLPTIRRRLSYANVAATLALLFSMSGGAFAASHYLITSSKQINPKVLTALKGKSGKTGAPGPAGSLGPQGPQGIKGEPGVAGSPGAKGENGAKGANGENGTAGPQGEPGPAGPEGSPWTAGGTLPSAKTETGSWVSNGYAATAGEAERTAISFPIPLETAPAAGRVHYVAFGETIPSGCTGDYTNPGAEPGNLCVFAQTATNLSFIPGSNFDNPASGTGLGLAGKYGVLLLFQSEAAGIYTVFGTWAVTAA